MMLNMIRNIVLSRFKWLHIRLWAPSGDDPPIQFQPQRIFHSTLPDDAKHGSPFSFKDRAFLPSQRYTYQFTTLERYCYCGAPASTSFSLFIIPGSKMQFFVYPSISLARSEFSNIL